jgi:hypothetical protein
VAARFTNLPPIGENLHRPESGVQDTVRAARLFRLFHGQGLDTPAVVWVASQYRGSISRGLFDTKPSFFGSLRKSDELLDRTPFDICLVIR